MICKNGECVGPGNPCFGSMNACQGSDTIAYCLDGTNLRINCSDLGPGFKCQGVFPFSARCQQDTECNPGQSSGTETCVGDKLQICNGGKLEEIDCLALGFSGCSGTRCVP
jgi:hypothetical protein